MLWDALWRQDDKPVDPTEDELRLFPIVGLDRCFPVASLLSRGKLEEAGRLVPERAWAASTPLYG